MQTNNQLYQEGGETPLRPHYKLNNFEPEA